MNDCNEILTAAVAHGASDIFLVSGLPVSFKENGEILRQDDRRLLPDDTKGLLRGLYALAGREIEPFLASGDDDFSVSLSGLSRFRVSAYRQRGSLAAVIRVIPFGIPDRTEMGIPDEVMEIAERSRGLVLVTGAAGNGKSTTLACVIDAINRSRNVHIITLEDPIEYVHRNQKSVVSQREIASDTDSYLTALRASLRQAPDVILLGEMRDYETIKTALTAAETGHLVLSTLHTTGAVNTVDRIIDVFPPNQQAQIRIQLSMQLQTVVSQQLLQSENGSLVPAFEIMHVTPAIRTLIRESKTHQIDAVIATSSAEGMRSMDASLLELATAHRVTADMALRHAVNPDQLARKLKAAL